MFCFQLHAKENVEKECKDLQSFLSTSSFKIDCNPHFQHYNSKAIKKYYNKSDAIRNGLKMATFNLLYPGNSRNRYKDYKILAKMMNKWDLIGAQELVPSQGEEFHHNQMLMTSRASSAKLIREHYKIPGFLIILNELRKIDPSWALLISGKAEAAKEQYSKELGGFFYRASTVKPIDNDFCEDNYDNDGSSLGCLADFTKETIGKEANSIFSRRPFMASFKSGNFDFTALTSHVVYTSPTDPAARERIVKKAFGVKNYKDLGKGVTTETYARFAEIKVTFQFMEYLWSYYDEEDIILLGDFNVESKNPFWKKIQDEFEGSEVLNSAPTTLTDQKYKFLRGKEIITNGVSRNYDHIVLNREYSKECSGEAKPFNFLEDNNIGLEIKKKYIVRSSKKRGSTYPISASNEKKMNALIKKYKKKLENKLTIKRNKVVKDTKDIKRYVSGYKKRVFQSQKKDRSYYHLYKEIISDHLPVYMSCDTSGSDDD